MPYASQRDRLPTNLELEKTPWPVPPLNLFLVGGVNAGVFDLQWDDPAMLSLNSSFNIVGVNIYRAFDSEYGPFERITTLPVGSMFWRDQTDNVMVVDEDVSNSFILRGTGQDAGELYNGRFVFRTLHCPIVKAGSQRTHANSAEDVLVFVDGKQAGVLSVQGWSGEVELDNQQHPEVGTQTRLVPVLPGPSSVVTCSYRYNRSLLQTNLAQRVFYRVTTVATPAGGVDLIETPLERAAATSSYEIEKLDWIWREAVRRNRWILTQGGERVKLFLQRANGVPCSCTQNPQYKQPLNDCPICYGTGSMGGYDGPYDALLAPDDAEKKITQGATGRFLEHTYEVWTGPTPLLAQRDFLVKINGERYSISGVRFPTNRGMILQQHFNIGYIDSKDIRYSVPIDGNVDRYTARQLPAMLPDDPVMGTSSPPAGITNKPGIPDERELRGRNVVWENIVY
jgi:hypothetical protein